MNGSWISSDEKPEDGQDVLGVTVDALDGTRWIDVVRWSNRDREWVQAGTLEPLFKVTHWMPLPELPQR